MDSLPNCRACGSTGKTHHCNTCSNWLCLRCSNIVHNAVKDHKMRDRH